MIQYLQGDATCPQGDGDKIICHICNDAGAWGAGFVLALSKAYPEPEKQYKAWGTSGHTYQLGTVQFVPVSNDITVANMVGQHGIGRGTKPIRYDAVRQCLEKVAEHARKAGASVHMPRIGCGLAGGDWKEIEKIIQETMPDVKVFVYDLASTRVLIVGSRTFADYDLMCATVDPMLTGKTSIEIVSGGAKGADSIAERYARERGYKFTVMPADWDKYGKSAGYIRNEQMHEYIARMPEKMCIAFWDGKSKGTAHNFELATKYNNPLYIRRF